MRHFRDDAFCSRKFTAPDVQRIDNHGSQSEKFERHGVGIQGDVSGTCVNGGPGSESTTAAAKNLSFPSNANMYIRLPNGKFIPLELGATWINYVEDGARMTQDERATIEKILQEGSIDDPQKAALSKL